MKIDPDLARVLPTLERIYDRLGGVAFTELTKAIPPAKVKGKRPSLATVQRNINRKTA